MEEDFSFLDQDNQENTKPYDYGAELQEMGKQRIHFADSKAIKSYLSPAPGAPKLVFKAEMDPTGAIDCPVINCNQSVMSANLLRNHLNACHTRVRCAECGEFQRPKDLHVHQERYHGVLQANAISEEGDATFRKVRGVFICAVRGCEYTTSAKDNVERHADAHEKVMCHLCGKPSSKARLAHHVGKQHQSNKVGRFECLDCARQFSKEELLKAHSLSYHGIGEEDLQSCANCKRMFGRDTGIHRHEKVCIPPPAKKVKFIHRDKNKTTHIKVPFDEDRPNNCPYEGCDFYHERRFTVRSHYIGAHCKQKCPYCGKILNFYHMENHIVMAHTKDYKHVCKVCNAGFFKEHRLTQHMDEEHVKELKYVCEECGKAFFSYKKMYSHYNKYHMNAGKFRCDPCAKVYTNKSSLIKHLRTQHQGAGINELFKGKNGKYTQVRKFRHVKDEDLEKTVDKALKEQSYFKETDPILDEHFKAEDSDMSGIQQ